MDTPCVYVKVRHLRGSFHLINIYCQFRDSIEIYLLKLNAIFGQLRETAIIAGDFNAHSTVWFDQITNSRGNKLKDWTQWTLFSFRVGDCSICLY